MSEQARQVSEILRTNVAALLAEAIESQSAEPFESIEARAGQDTRDAVGASAWAACSVLSKVKALVR